MKRLFIALTVCIAASIGAKASDGDLFKYPTPPADMENLQERCDYLVTHFWERCDFKSAFSKKEALHNTFGDWVSFMPYASADSVHAAIDRLLTKVHKSGPHTLGLARMAEDWTYSDTSFVHSEEIYYPFAKAAADNGKIKGADKARFAAQVQIMDNSRQGAKVEHLQWTDAEGRGHSIDEVGTQLTLVLFNDYDCDNCTLARVRLSADINARTLIDAGILTVLNIQPEEADAEWLAAVTTYPKEWLTGTWADADEYFSLRTSPAYYLLDSRHRVLVKDFDTDGLLAVLATLRANSGL